MRCCMLSDILHGDRRIHYSVTNHLHLRPSLEWTYMYMYSCLWNANTVLGRPTGRKCFPLLSVDTSLPLRTSDTYLPRSRPNTYLCTISIAPSCRVPAQWHLVILGTCYLLTLFYHCCGSFRVRPVSGIRQGRPEHLTITERSSFDTPPYRWRSCFSVSCITDMELSSTGSHVAENIIDIQIHSENLLFLLQIFVFFCTVTALLCTIHF